MWGKIEQFRVTKILAFRGLAQQEIDEATPGDIVTIAGMSKATVSDTLCALAVDEPLEAQPIDPPPLQLPLASTIARLQGVRAKKYNRVLSVIA